MAARCIVYVIEIDSEVWEPEDEYLCWKRSRPSRLLDRGVRITMCAPRWVHNGYAFSELE